MKERALAARLARGYCHQLNAFRPTAHGETLLYSAVRCAMSRSAQVSAPLPPGMGAVIPEVAFRLSLFTKPEVVLFLGDRLEIRDKERIWHATASDSIRYPAHTATVIQVERVVQQEGEEVPYAGGDAK